MSRRSCFPLRSATCSPTPPSRDYACCGRRRPRHDDRLRALGAAMADNGAPGGPPDGMDSAMPYSPISGSSSITTSRRAPTATAPFRPSATANRSRPWIRIISLGRSETGGSPSSISTAFSATSVTVYRWFIIRGPARKAARDDEHVRVSSSSSPASPASSPSASFAGLSSFPSSYPETWPFRGPPCVAMSTKARWRW